jgi:hypothetical protein
MGVGVVGGKMGVKVQSVFDEMGAESSALLSLTSIKFALLVSYNYLSAQKIFVIFM